ncbi:MAG TPA: hypothetical protein VJ873_01060, partial [bacterium]|nr:hypothetical protein [bacterium]
MLVLTGYYFGYQLPHDISSKKQRELEAKLAADKPHKEIIAMIDDLKAHGTALPPCPLIYPLLDNKGKITYLGSYLSYFAMKQGSYLPHTVFRIPNAGEIYNEFGLFDPDSPMHLAYRTQLPLYFGTKDLGEGKLLKSGSSYRIQLRFWGTHPEKKYSKTFKKGKLHLAISWMSSCLQDYAGYHPTAEEAGYMAKPIFTNDEDLNRAARSETYFRNGGPALVLNWDKILAKNPENPYLLNRWISVLGSRDGVHRLDMLEPLIKKYPDATFYKLEYAYELYLSEKYDDGFKVAYKEMMRDDNDPDWYEYAAEC